MTRPNTPLWDSQSAVRDDPILSRLHEIAVEKLYLRLKRIEYLTMTGFGVVVGVWLTDAMPAEYDLIFLSLAIVPWLLAKYLKNEPVTWQNSLNALYDRIGVQNQMPGMLTSWVLLHQEDKWPHKGHLLVRRLFRTPAGAIRFARRNDIKLKNVFVGSCVMWVDGAELYRACQVRRETPSGMALSSERSKLLDDLKEGGSDSDSDSD